jgi:hypothetical protein
VRPRTGLGESARRRNPSPCRSTALIKFFEDVMIFVFFHIFGLYGGTEKNYKLIIIRFSDNILCIISTSTHFHYVKFVGRKSKCRRITV